MCWLATRTRKSVSLSRTKQLLLHRTFNIPGTYNHLPMVPNYLLVLDSLVGNKQQTRARVNRAPGPKLRVSVRVVWYC